jgi:hypothetical protein
MKSILTLLAVAASLASAQTYVVSYTLGTGGNQTQLADGATLTFPPTAVNSTVAATIIVKNTGPAAGLLKKVTPFGSVFTTGGLGLLPLTLTATGAGAETRFTLNFTPSARGSFNAALQVEFDTGFITINLGGQGIGPTLVVGQVRSTGEVVPIISGGTLRLADTALGATTIVNMQLRNEGEVAASVTTISLVGTGYSLQNVLPAPFSIPPQGTLTFSVRFTPQGVGEQTGVLLVNSFIVNLASRVLGATFGYSFSISGVTTPVNNSGVLLIPNTAVGGKVTGQFTVTNNGNTTGTVSNVNITGAGLSVNPLALPQTLEPGASMTIGVNFSPLTLATSTGTLSVDTASFVVRGTGTTPDAIPGFSFGGVGATSQPLQQPSVSLRLDSPYPSDISGRLTLSFRSDAQVDDPSIQFATGGRTVNFTIPANTVNAVFGAATQTLFQTGSVAGAITITPSFSIGTVDVTPAQPTAKSVAIPVSGPQLVRATIGARTATSLEILITGYAPSRSMQQMILDFTAANDRSLQTKTLTVDVNSAFGTWYQTAASATVGSQFTASITLNVSGNTDAVQSVRITAANSNGTSSPVTASLQ